VSCLTGKPLAFRAFDRNGFSLHVIDAKFGTGILAEIKFAQVSVEVLGINVLINTNNSAFEDAEKSFERIGMNVAANPFELGVVMQAGKVWVPLYAPQYTKDQ
jgi:hypothetical protein